MRPSPSILFHPLTNPYHPLMPTPSDSAVTPPGLVVLFGSGETSPSGGKILQALAPRLARPLRIAVLETPAGFEPNSAQVAERVAEFMRVRLQNDHPTVDVIPARQRRTAFSPDDPALAARLHRSNLIFLGPGSPTYAARQLQDSVVWDAVRAQHRRGAALVFASAAALALSPHTLPVYEIYKAGEELHWHPGLNFFGAFGLSLTIIPHWNNAEGGAELDTSRCFMGHARWEQLTALLPPDTQVLGIDERTALVMDFGAAIAEVMGAGGVILRRGEESRRTEAGQRFPLSDLGDLRLPPPLPALPTTDDEPSAEVMALMETRRAARAQRDWPTADAVRTQLSVLGWEVQDTPAGPQLNRIQR